MCGKTVEDCIKEVKNLEDKASLSREICAYKYRSYKWVSRILSLFILLFSALIAFLSVADPAILLALPLIPHDLQDMRNVIAFLGFTIFIISFSDKILGLTETMNKSEQGVKLLTDFIRDCHAFRDVGSNDCDEKMAALKLESIKEQYSHLNQILALNTVSNMTFLRIKKAYKQKVKVSKMLDKDPNINLKEHYLMSLKDWFFWKPSRQSDSLTTDEKRDEPMTHQKTQ